MGAADMGAAPRRSPWSGRACRPGEIDVIVVSTATPDRLLPSTACDMQALIGATNAAAFDISAACSGFIYALQVAEGYIAAGRGEVALVVSAEKMSGIVDWTDRADLRALRRWRGRGRGAQGGQTAAACCPTTCAPTARWPNCSGGRPAA
jgi:3-oxoacyl-[acyl-carrier-protein] synthase III